MISRITIAILVLLLAGSIGANWWVMRTNTALSQENMKLSLAFGSCENRNINILEDRKRDEEAADPLFVPPARWFVQ